MAQLQSWGSFKSIKQLELFIKHRVPIFENMSFQNLHRAISEFNQCNVLKDLVPKILSLAEDASNSFETYVKRRGHQAEMSKRDIARMMANGFFCNFESPDEHLNFCKLYNNPNDTSSDRETSKVEKLKCLLEYFRQVTSADCTNLDEVVTFKHCQLSYNQSWETLNTKMGDFTFELDKNMFDCDKHMAQVDFANKHIGGGVMGNGCVQEEIKFITCPELIVSATIFKEYMRDNEAIVITGAAPYAKYTGYGRSFKYVGPVSRSEKENCSKTIIAIDALNFNESSHYGSRFQQFSKEGIDRELLKAYVGFSNCEQRDIASGNWGCGAFGGDVELKMCIQWLAATLANKKLYYFGFSDQNLRNAYDYLISNYSFYEAGEFYNELVRLSDIKQKMYPNSSLFHVITAYKKRPQPTRQHSLPNSCELANEATEQVPVRTSHPKPTSPENLRPYDMQLTNHKFNRQDYNATNIGAFGQTHTGDSSWHNSNNLKHSRNAERFAQKK